MTRIAGAKRERFLPYRYARGGVDLSVVACTVDGKTRVEPASDAHLVDLEGEWRRASLSLGVAVPATTLAEVAEGEGASAFELAIVLRCADTLVREALRIPLRAADEATTWPLEIERDRLAGSAHLVAYLVRTKPHRSRTPLVRGARVADSRRWEIRIDKPRQPKGEYLDIRYKKFSEDESLPIRDRGNLYVLDFDQESPILWSNSDHDRVAGILDSKGTIGRTARLRETFFDHIAYSVWTQLFLKASADLIAGDGETTYEWQDAVLELVLRDVFPEIRNATERKSQLIDMREDWPELMRRLDAGLQRRNDLAAHLTKLVDEEDAS